MYMVTPATEASMMTVGQFAKIFDPGKNGLKLIDDFVMKLKDEFASNDPNVVSSYVPFLDDEMERPVEMCSLEMYLLHNVNLNDKVVIFADARHTLETVEFADVQSQGKNVWHPGFVFLAAPA